MSTPAGSAQSLFIAAVADALKHYNDPQWLGKNSPLASPYLLTNRLYSRDNTAATRGEILQTLLADALNSIQGSNAERYQTILRAYHIEGGTVAEVGKFVGLARNSFNLNRKAAIDALAEVLVSQLHPALRLESPPAASLLLERDELIEECLTQIEHMQTIALTGGSGIGKTALAAHLVDKIDQPIFWYTIRPSLTDQLESMVFALGLFAHNHGASTLWQELIATDGQVLHEKALAWCDLLWSR